MVFGSSGAETGAAKNEQLFKSNKKQAKTEQKSTAQDTGRFMEGKAGRVKVEHEKGKETTENVFRVLGQYLKGNRNLYGQKMKDARQAFGLMDKNGGGTVDGAEFDKALKRLGFVLTEAQMVDVLSIVDIDGSGEVDYGEFIKMLGMDGGHDPEQGTRYDPQRHTMQGREEVMLQQAAAQAPDAAQVDRNTHTQAVGYHLAAAEKMERQVEKLFSMMKKKLEDKWSLFGEELDGEVENFFMALDTDKSGYLDHAELGEALKRMDLGLTDQQVVDVMESTDEDGSGTIECVEWLIRFNAKPIGFVHEMVSESTVGGSVQSESSVGTLEAVDSQARLNYIARQPPIPASRLAFEKDMADAMAVLDADAGRKKKLYGRAQTAADAMIFSAGRTKLRLETARAPGVLVSRPWPPQGSAPGSARELRRWHEGETNHIESARSTMAAMNGGLSPRSSRTVCSARDPRGTGMIATPPASARRPGIAEKPLWGALEWGQSRLFYPGPGGNVSTPAPPTTH